MSSADVDALHRAKGGDAEAFGEFFDNHGAAVLRYFRIRTAAAAVAADLCAETFAAALESLGRYDPDRAEPVAWLYGIARNNYLRWLRSIEVERRARERLQIQTPAHTSDDLDLVELRADLAGLLGNLDGALAQLTDSTRRAVELRILDELPYKAVAEHLGCTEGAARVRVSRGLDALLAHLGEEVPEQ